MKAIVVFESMFGNTEAVAHAVAEGIGKWASVTVLPVAAAPTVVGPEIHLLVVGGPTHALGLSRTSTRTNAVEQGAEPVTPIEKGIREWLAEVTVAPTTGVTAFDTRVVHPRLPGSAAKAALRRIRRRGGTPIAAAESFGVAGTRGPLLDGELERARDWGVLLEAAEGHLVRDGS